MIEQTDRSKEEIEVAGQPDPSSTVPDGCPRCQGFLVQTFFQVDLLGESGPRLTPAWRCVNCGVLLDLQVLENQALDSEVSPLSSPSYSPLKSRSPRGGPRLHGHIGAMRRR